MAATKSPSGNIFTKKYGPLPGWVWVLGGVAAIYFWERRSGASGTAAATNSSASSDGSAANPSAYSAGYYPASASQSSTDSSTLESLLSVLASNAASTAPSPGNTSAPAVTPGNTGSPAIQPQPLVPVNSQSYAMNAPSGSSMVEIGTIDEGQSFSGFNVGGGAPEYAFVNGQYQQDFNWKTTPVGTGIYVPSTFSSYIASTPVSKQTT